MEEQEKYKIALFYLTRNNSKYSHCNDLFQKCPDGSDRFFDNSRCIKQINCIQCWDEFISDTND
jgi:hypothetical protein